ncbi:trigger factor [soil metagenome]
MPVTENDLQIAVEEGESWSRRVSITVPRSRVQRVRSSVAAQLAQRARLPGFRAGKLPRSVLEQRFGETIDGQTLDRLIQEAYREALESGDFQPITQGAVENVKYAPDADLSFDVRFEVQPRVELARVSGFTVSRPQVNIGEDEVDGVVDGFRNERAEWNALDSAPDYGDRVTVEIQRLDDAEAGPPRTYRFALGEEQAIPAVEEAILTLAPGEAGEFPVHFPEDTGDPETAGTEQRLKIHVTSAERKTLPELDDNFARSLGDFADLAELRTRVGEDLQTDAERRADAEVRRQLIAQISDANPLDLPASLLERYLQHMLGGEQDAKRERTPEEEARREQIEQVLKPQAEFSLKRMLIIENLADREGLRATQDDVDARVEEIAERSERSPADVWLQLEKGGQLQELESEITDSKVFDYLISRNTVKTS